MALCFSLVSLSIFFVGFVCFLLSLMFGKVFVNRRTGGLIFDKSKNAFIGRLLPRTWPHQGKLRHYRQRRC